jgi:formylglycine-generating enzyme required for sulfatase activity
MVLGGRALAQHPIPESERWATITHPGNAPYVFDRNGIPYERGRVDYEYQISRTEVTGTEWFEFVQAYAPYVQEDAVAGDQFTSRSVITIGYREYLLPAVNANRPVEIGWRFAARYMNWLHNGKALTPDAFESGAYDTSTFGSVPGVGFTDQQSRSPGARYWIPSADEWTKAAHFDPNRYGEGMPGYWLSSNSSDAVPFPPGLPQNGGLTSTGGLFAFPLPDIASYPGVQSPWGLLDCSGGFAEWTETVHYSNAGDPLPRYRFVQGSSWIDSYVDSELFHFDQIDGIRLFGPTTLFGLRVTRAVPGATSVGVFVCALSLLSRRRRCIDETVRSDRVFGRHAGGWHILMR